MLGQGPIPSSGVASVAINVTVTAPTEPSYVTVWPAGGVVPETSTVNFAPGVTVPNAAIVAVAGCGKYSISNIRSAKAFQDANLLYGKGDYRNAAPLYEKAVSLNPDLGFAYFFLKTR